MPRSFTIFLILGVVLAACAPDRLPPPSRTAAPTRPSATLAATRTPAPHPTSPNAAATVTPVPAAQGVVMMIWDDAARQHSLRLVDPNTGQTLPDHPPIEFGEVIWWALSPDRQRVAVMSYPSASAPRDGHLLLIDLAAWQVAPTDYVLDAWINVLAFGPNNNALVFSYSSGLQHTLARLDLTSFIAQSVAVGFQPTRLAFAPDTTLLLYGRASTEVDRRNPIAHVAAFSLETLAPVWDEALSIVLDGVYYPSGGSTEALEWHPAVAFDAPRQRLYLVLADSEHLLTVDFAAQTTTLTDIRRPQSWLDQWLAATAQTAEAAVTHNTTKAGIITADGQTLYLTGETRTTANGVQARATLGLSAIDANTGNVLLQVEATGTDLRFAADDRTLLLNDSFQRQFQATAYDAASLVELKTYANQQLFSGLSRDGRPYLVSLNPTQTVGRCWLLDFTTLERRAPWPSRSYLTFVEQP